MSEVSRKHAHAFCMEHHIDSLKVELLLTDLLDKTFNDGIECEKIMISVERLMRKGTPNA